MTTSIDTNVLVDLLNPDDALNRPALAAIEKAKSAGKLIVCGAVYAELLGLPSRTQAVLDEFFKYGGVSIDWRFDEAIWRAAGVAFQSYVKRRIANQEKFPRRILTDFLIGAHAVVRGCTLLTVDKRVYKASFPEIRIRSV
jgi:hypothetical protein